MYADYSRKLNTDVKQDWILISASEEQGVTFLQVSRPFDTCDPHDYPITVINTHSVQFILAKVANVCKKVYFVSCDI